MDIDYITDSWELAAKSSRAQGYIHPAGDVSKEEYERSGVVSAGLVDEVAQAYLLHLGADVRILDFGCGDGRVLKHLMEMGYGDCWGADASTSMLDRLGQRVPGAMAVKSNGIDGGLEDINPDLIYSLAVFIHHSIDGGKQILRGLANAAKEGSILALQIPCYDEKRERGEWIDVTVWTPDELSMAAKAAGLQVIELHASPGEFSYENVGVNHLRLQVFRKG